MIIYGSNLSTVTTIYFGGTAATSTTVNSATQITAVVGYGSSGYVTAYSSTYGNISSSLYFTYTGTATAPTITTFSPTSGQIGTSVIITGNNLSNASSVSFGGTAAQSYTVNSATQITAVVGTGASGAVSVTTPYGTATLGGFNFTSTTASTSLTGKVDSAGKFNTDVTASSPDNLASVTIASGVTGKLGGAALTQISVTKVDTENVPGVPTASGLVSGAYDFSPNGATFDKPVTISLTYDSSLLPAGVAESSIFACWWDSSSNKWVSLSSKVDTVNKKVSAQIDHFTIFSVMGSTQKATFGVSDLQISPKEVQAGKEVTISVIVGNVGLVSGSYEVNLIINGKVESVKKVENVPGGNSMKVNFTYTPKTAGTYKAEVDYLNGTFTVTAAPTTPAVTTTPATTTPPTTTIKPTTTTAATTPAVTTTKPTPTDEPSGGVNWWLIGGVIVIFLIIVWIIYRVIIYQRKQIK